MTPEDAPWYLFIQPLIVLFLLLYGVTVAMHPHFLRARLRGEPPDDQTSDVDQIPVKLPRPAVERKPLDLKPKSFSDQLDSPLFHKIPAEIRNEIFMLALTQYEDMSQPYPEDAYYYRPGYRARRRIDTALLRTCQRVYFETRAVPISNYEHTVWGCVASRAPPRQHNQMNHLDWFPSTMYPDCGLDADLCLGNVRFFTQAYWLEDNKGLSQIILNPKFQTRKISVVIRHTDNFHWEYDRALAFDSEWTRALSCPNTCRELEIEFETVERKKQQLDNLIAHLIFRWNFKRRDDQILTTNLDSIKISRWTGSRRIDGKFWSEDRSSDRLDYYIVSVSWRLNNIETEELSSDDTTAAQVLERLATLSSIRASSS